jgi:hypothetical protein
MAKKRALKDTVKDPVAKKQAPTIQSEKNNIDGSNTTIKILVSLLLGFAGGLLTGRFMKII